MNKVNAHLEYETIIPFVSEVSTEFSDVPYRVIFLGSDTNLFMTEIQAEALFQELDIKLHECTVTSENMKAEIAEMEDKIWILEDDLAQSNEECEQLRENRDNQEDDGERDFYEE